MASPQLTSQSYSALYTTHNTAFEHKAAFGSRKVQTYKLWCQEFWNCALEQFGEPDLSAKNPDLL